MKKKKYIPIIVIGIVLLALVGSYFLMPNFYKSIFSSITRTPLALAPPSGCDFIPNTENPSNVYTQQVNSGVFTCDADRCFVSGVMTVEKPSSTPKVVMRTCGVNGYGSSCIIYVDTNLDGILEKYYSNSITTSVTGNLDIPFLTPEGLKMKLRLGGELLIIGVTQNGRTNNYLYKIDQTQTSTDITPKTNCQGTETCYGSAKYTGYFQFCPAGNSNFPYCSGTKNNVQDTIPNTYYTDEAEIIGGQGVSFNPVYEDGSSITTRYIRVRKYDCSCQPAVVLGEACTNDQYYCKTSSSEYTLSNTCYGNNNQFSSLRCNDGSAPTRKDGQNGCGSSLSKPYCLQIETNKYEKCDGKQTIGSSQCGAFTSATYSCPTGQQCFVTATNAVGDGIGACKCDVNSCVLGDKVKVGDASYKECVVQGSCTAYSAIKDCPTGLVFDAIAKECVCGSDNACNPLESQCASTNQIRKCSLQTIGTKTCYKWAAASSCPGEQLCDNKNTVTNDDVCDCKAVDECSLTNTMKCITTNTYSVCSKDQANLATSCLKYRETKPVGELNKCENNQITLRPDIGCAFNTPGYQCNAAIFEQCVDNTCICKQDNFTATQTNYLNLQTRCGNSKTIQQVSKYQSNVSACYRWTFNSTCGDKEICRESGNSAICVPNYEYVGVFAKDQYGVNEPINGVGIDVTSNIGANSNLRVTARLFDSDGIELPNTRVDTLTNTQGKVNLSFNYKHKKQENLTINVIVDPQGQAYSVNETIEIAKALQIKLDCPAGGYVKRDITCSWKVEDAETSSLLDIVPTISIKQGQTTINYNTVGTTKVIFSTQNLGTIDIDMVAGKNGYISAKEVTRIQIQDLQRDANLLVDNKDYDLYGGLGIATGQREIKFDVKESGQQAEVNRVEAIITTPSGAETSLVLTKESAGVYKTLYTFDQAGSTYNIRAKILYQDTALEPTIYEQKILTLGTITEDQKNAENTLTIIIGLGIFFALVVVFGVIYTMTRRRRK